jgi:DNA segregation ATPase FtsK/SpoIIIE, S-DNA-T family
MFHQIWYALCITFDILRILIPALVLGRLALAVVRFARLDHAGRRHWLPARWHRAGWKRLARNVGLAYQDKHLGGLDSRRPPKVVYPRVRFRPGSHGWVVRMKLIPGVKREDVEKAAEHLANRWGCARVGVTQPKPGRLLLHAVRRDPLAETFPATLLPAFDGRHVTLGRDEWGTVRRLSLANHAGSVWSGLPGRGKSECALSWAVQLAASPLVDLHVLDGGELDWQGFAAGAAGYTGADLDAAADMLAGLDQLMRDRRRNLQADLGVRNAWAVGPSDDYRLQWVMLEEAPAFLSLESVKGDKKRESLVLAIRGLAANLLRRGRAPLFHTSLIAQKPSTTSLPPDIRDLAGVRWSFGCATLENAVACLGDDIRQYPTLQPTLLQSDEHVGVASALLRTGLSPYTWLKFPAVGQQLSDQVAADLVRCRTESVSVSSPGLELVKAS